MVVNRGDAEAAKPRSLFPAQRLRDVFDDVRDKRWTTSDTQLRRHRQKQGVRHLNRLVTPQLFDEGVRFVRIGTAEHSPRRRVDVAHAWVTVLESARELSLSLDLRNVSD